MAAQGENDIETEDNRSSFSSSEEAGNGNPLSMNVAKWRTTLGHRFWCSPIVRSFIIADSVNWKRHGGPAIAFLLATVCIAVLVAVTTVVAFALLFIFSSLNAAFASFLVALSTVCFIMAFFFSSITVVYVGALGFGGLTIGSIAFFSVWAVIILSGWGAIAWIIWQALRKTFKIGRRLAFLAASFLVSCCPPAHKLLFFGSKVKGYRYSSLSSKKTAMD